MKLKYVVLAAIGAASLTKCIDRHVMLGAAGGYCAGETINVWYSDEPSTWKKLGYTVVGLAGAAVVADLTREMPSREATIILAPFAAAMIATLKYAGKPNANVQAITLHEPEKLYEKLSKIGEKEKQDALAAQSQPKPATESQVSKQPVKS